MTISTSVYVDENFKNIELIHELQNKNDLDKRDIDQMTTNNKT